MRYVVARINEYNRDEAYRIFVTKSLQLIPQQKYIEKNYYDIVNPKASGHEDLNGEEIVQNIMKKAGLSFGE